MEGRREEYLTNKGRTHAMFADCLENALLLEDQALPPDPCSSLSSPTISPSLNNDTLLPPFANLCVSSSMPNTDLRNDLYIYRDIKSLSRVAFASLYFNSAALVSLVALYNALLDSGCTHHIVRDRTLFQNYTARAISVGTANCGSLEALGTGDVEFRYPFGERHVTFTLCG